MSIKCIEHEFVNTLNKSHFYVLSVNMSYCLNCT